MRLNNVQRNAGYRDEYIYNIKTGKFYLRAQGDNYKEVTLPGNPDLPTDGGDGGDSNTGNPILETPDFSGSYQQASQEENYGPDVTDSLAVGTVFDVMVFAGQSNMVGRGNWTGVGNWPKSGTSYTMNYDMSGIGVQETTNSFRSKLDSSNGSMQTAFARVYGETAQRRTLLVPAAKGGAKIEEFTSGQVYYSMLLQAVQDAKDLCQAKGWVVNSFTIHWHQGESDQYNLGYAGDIGKYMADLKSIQESIDSDVPNTVDYWVIHRVGIDSGATHNAAVTSGDANKAWNILRAQSAVAAQNPNKFKLGYLNCAKLGGGLHYTQAGYNQWGEESGVIVSNLINDNQELNMWDDDPSLTDVWGVKPEMICTIDSDGKIQQFGTSNLTWPENPSTDADGNINAPLSVAAEDTFARELDDTTSFSIAMNYGSASSGYTRLVYGNPSDWFRVDNNNNAKFNTDETGRTTISLTSLGMTDASGVHIYSDGDGNLKAKNETTTSQNDSEIKSASIAFTAGSGGSIEITSLLDQVVDISIGGFAISTQGNFADYFSWLMFAPSRNVPVQTELFYKFDNSFIDLTNGVGAELTQSGAAPVYASNGDLNQKDTSTIITSNKSFSLKETDEWAFGFELSVPEDFAIDSENHRQPQLATTSSVVGASNTFIMALTLMGAYPMMRLRVDGKTNDVNVESIYTDDGAGTRFQYVAHYVPGSGQIDIYLDGTLTGSLENIAGFDTIFYSTPCKNGEIYTTNLHKTRVLIGSGINPATFLADPTLFNESDPVTSDNRIEMSKSSEIYWKSLEPVETELL